MEIGKADLAKTTRELSCSPMLQTCFDIMICRVYQINEKCQFQMHHEWILEEKKFRKSFRARKYSLWTRYCVKKGKKRHFLSTKFHNGKTNQSVFLLKVIEFYADIDPLCLTKTHLHLKLLLSNSQSPVAKAEAFFLTICSKMLILTLFGFRFILPVGYW